jgi:hypothetical protein
VLTTVLRDQRPIHVIEEEEPLQLRLRQLAPEPPVRRHLLIRQELHRHGRSTYDETNIPPPAPAYRYFRFRSSSAP